MEDRRPSVVEPKAGFRGRSLVTQIEQVNKELWIILSMFVIAAVLNFAVAAQRMVVSLYTLPTILSAYIYGRRHATLTAVGSSMVVVLLLYARPWMFAAPAGASAVDMPWLDVLLWASVLVITGYLMGTLYEHKTAQLLELRETYYGVLEILRHFVSNDKYTENHSYRVSYYATRIATILRFPQESIEDVRAAGLLHDIGKLQIGREILYKAASLTREEHADMQRHVALGVEMLATVGGSLRRVLPIVLAHHERYDTAPPATPDSDGIPLAARVIKVADVYDSLTSDRPYRKAMPPFEVKSIIVNGSGTEFDPVVVQAFVSSFDSGALELPQLTV
jgi:putative nucleotidyltransferase with HDIG domain